MKIRIKVCCISSQEEARLAVHTGADAIGLVGHMPSGPGIISDEEIKKIARQVPPPIATFLLTSETSAEKIIFHHQQVYTNTIQMVDSLTVGSYQQIRKALPGIKLVQVIHVANESSVEEAVKVASEVDAILLDSGNPFLKTKKLGGTGKVHDWTLSRKIRVSIEVPVWLAGGLHSGNVRQAIHTVAPFGVDLCSGVRTDEKLDAKKLKQFIEAAQSN